MTGPAFGSWIGRTETARDRVTLQSALRLAATLDVAPGRVPLEDGAPLPPLWHWTAFAGAEPASGLGPDGHPRRGGFLPPVPLERRMWAGGKLAFHAPIRIGEPLERRSEIVSVVPKPGAAGEMVFVTVAHRITDESGAPRLEETHDVVYVARPGRNVVARPGRYVPPRPVEPPPNPFWSDPAPIDTVVLFRFSAVTFNGHRIHYDLAYSREVEGYPGLVVHGPLQALLLIGAAERHRPGARAATFAFRGVRPVFHTDTLRLVGAEPEGDAQDLCAVTGEGFVSMQARVTWVPPDPDER